MAKQTRDADQIRAEIKRLQEELYFTENDIDISKFLHNYITDDEITYLYVTKIHDIDVDNGTITVSGTQYYIDSDGDPSNDDISEDCEDLEFAINNTDILTKSEFAEIIQEVINERTGTLNDMLKHIKKDQ